VYWTLILLRLFVLRVQTAPAFAFGGFAAAVPATATAAHTSALALLDLLTTTILTVDFQQGSQGGSQRLTPIFDILESQLARIAGALETQAAMAAYDGSTASPGGVSGLQAAATAAAAGAAAAGPTPTFGAFGAGFGTAAAQPAFGAATGGFNFNFGRPATAAAQPPVFGFGAPAAATTAALKVSPWPVHCAFLHIPLHCGSLFVPSR
jgi:hypothetical protein